LGPRGRLPVDVTHAGGYVHPASQLLHGLAQLGAGVVDLRPQLLGLTYRLRRHDRPRSRTAVATTSMSLRMLRLAAAGTGGIARLTCWRPINAITPAISSSATPM